MPQTKQYLTRDGTNKTLDQILSDAKSDGIQIFSDGDWIIRISSRKRAITGSRGEILTLSDDDLDEIFGA